MLKFIKSKINNASEGYPPDMKTFKEPNIKRKILYSLIGLIIISLGVFIFYQSYALYEENKDFNVINGVVEDPGDLYFAYYVNNTITRDVPTKDSGLTLDTEKSTCTSGVTVSWDNDNWHAILDYSSYAKDSTTRTKCTLYFKNKPIVGKDILTYVKNNADASSKAVYTVPGKTSDSCTYTLSYDGTTDNNLRYVGANPCNYVKIDDETWRIVGVMNNIDDGTGKKESRIKLIKEESIGTYSWDTSASSVNSGYGVNEWSQADLMKLLNPGYESESIGGSLYYNGSSGTCYSSNNNGTKSCVFTSSGLKSNLKSLIGDTLWNTGTNGTSSYSSSSNGLASHFYSYERSNNTSKICTSGTPCNDTVERTTIWQGKVGLIYPSDYGYATSGGDTSDRTSCTNKELSNWKSSSYSDCKGNNWLYMTSGTYQWTITSNANSSMAFRVFMVTGGTSGGYLSVSGTALSGVVRPTVYLVSTATLKSGEGTPESPYQIG